MTSATRFSAAAGAAKPISARMMLKISLKRRIFRPKMSAVALNNSSSTWLRRARSGSLQLRQVLRFHTPRLIPRRTLFSESRSRKSEEHQKNDKGGQK
jgi:hypothetical protein